MIFIFRIIVILFIFSFVVYASDTTPLGLPQWLAGFCATLKLVTILSSAETGEPSGQARWGTSVGHVFFAIQPDSNDPKRLAQPAIDSRRQRLRRHPNAGPASPAN